MTGGSRWFISGEWIGFFAPWGLGVERRCWGRRRDSTQSKARRKGAKKASHREVGWEVRVIACGREMAHCVGPLWPGLGVTGAKMWAMPLL